MANLTLLNTTLIEETGAAYIPSEFYFVLVALAFLFFFFSILVRKSDDINGILAAIFFAAAALLTASVEFISIGYQASSTTVYVVPVVYHPYTPYIAYIWGMMFLVCVINLFRIWFLNLKETAERKKAKE